VLTCPNCGRENPEEFQFCGFCTAPLAQDQATGLDERKVVTVLFCDLVGFTARSEHADPEDVRAILRRYHSRLKREIESFRGTVEKFIGDAVMAVFGAPVAHEDDPERAVRAGLRILEAIAELNEADPPMGLSVRIGVNTGETLVSLSARPEQGEGMVAGDVVNMAARLQSAAPVNGLVVGERTHLATTALFDYEELEPVAAKGRSEPLRLWLVLSLGARLGVDVTTTHATPLVGRQPELNRLIRLFDQSIQGACSQLAIVVGEPGMGKSRLVAELFAHVHANSELVRWRQGRCLPYGEGISFWALGEIVKAEAGILESDSAEAAAAKLEAAVSAEDLDREWLKARLGALVGIDSSPGAAREEAFTAWRRFLEAMAWERPTVLVFEDLHWADEAMLAFLDHLIELSEGVPLFLLCTARPELYERKPDWGGGTRTAATISLAPLSNEETARLVSTLLGAAVLPAEMQALVIERAGGNPLYAGEFVRMLKDRELLVQRGPTLALQEGAEIPFPDSVQALIAARLDTLSHERKALLQDAAVLGKVFWSGAVATMGGLEEPAVRDSLHELSRTDLVLPSGTSSMEGESEYAFWHLLVRDVAYGQIPRGARAHKHRAAAEWIEQRAPGRVQDLAEVLAHHYLQALELARADGQTWEAAELEAPALRFLLLAGDRSLGLDVPQADAYYSQALELATPGHPQRAAVLTRRAEAMRQSGRLAEAASAFEEAIADFRARGERLAAGRAAMPYSKVLYYLGDARWESVLSEGVALFEAEPLGPDLVEALADTAGNRFVRGSNREAIQWAERALKLASELGLAEPERALGFRGAARCRLGDAGGLDDMHRALELAQDRGLGRDAAILYDNLGEAVWPLEGPASALELLREGIDFAERRGIAEVAAGIASTSLIVLYELGEWDEAAAFGERLAQRSEASRLVLYMLLLRWTKARLLAYRGELAEAALHAEWAVAAARESGETQMIPGAFSVGALVQLGLGEPQVAAALLAELERVPAVRETVYYPAYLPEMVRTAVGCGDPALAERLREGVEPLMPLHEHARCTASAALAEARGELEQAAGLYAEAAERWERFGSVPERSHALLGLGRCLLALHRPSDAAQALLRARDIFSLLGANPALSETDALFERATALIS
jgi:class 3 adenylate cyclase/tetratricopeptide (TPR) repeat protein